MPCGVLQVMRSAWRARSTKRWLSASIARKSARIPSSMICAIDVHHVTVTNPVMIHHAVISHARAELAGLVCAAKMETCERARSSRISSGMTSAAVARDAPARRNCNSEPTSLDLGLQGRGDVAGAFIGDDGDALLRFQSKADMDRIPRARDKFRINRMEISAIGHIES